MVYVGRLLLLSDRLQKKIKKKEYASMAEFADDVELVFSNCQTFNQEHTLIWEDAEALRVRDTLPHLACC